MNGDIEQRTVSVHALSAGVFTLPERIFISPLSDPNTKKTVPSLSFLIQHHSLSANDLTRLIFDLGIRRDTSQYSPAIRSHLKSRFPLSTSPDVLASLALGGLSPHDIDFVILSHVHWDHIGTPSDFSHPKTKFVVGHGSLALLDGTTKLGNGSHSHFEEGLLPKDRTVELLDPEIPVTPPYSDDRVSFTEVDDGEERKGKDLNLRMRTWRPMSIFPAAIDVFGDGSLYIIDAPGHLPGHINLLCRTSWKPSKYILLGADSCHDRRLLTGEKEIAEWEDPGRSSVTHCIHMNKRIAKQTLKRIRDAEMGAAEVLGCVEVVFAHDPIWEADAKKNGRFWPGHL
jgi:glyoxylase-like metal-dependent hydrolase (beta-lactamase superfamily II)